MILCVLFVAGALLNTTNALSQTLSHVPRRQQQLVLRPADDRLRSCASLLTASSRCRKVKVLVFVMRLQQHSSKDIVACENRPVTQLSEGDLTEYVERAEEYKDTVAKFVLVPSDALFGNQITGIWPKEANRNGR